MQKTDTQPAIITGEKPAKHSIKRLFLCLAVLLVVALASVCVYFALTTAEQQKRIAALEETLSSQADVLSQQESTLEEQSNTLQEQSEALESNRSELEKQQKAINDQDKKIKQQQNTISDLKKQLVANKKTQPSVKPTTVPQATAKPVTLPDVSHLQGKKIVALTFDDGPGPYTERLLDAMKVRGVKATFFLLGAKVNQYASTIKRMETEGHLVGNHSQSHPQLTGLSTTGIKNDMDACASKIKAILGHEPAVMRCPYGSFNNNVRSYATEKGIPIIQWSVDTEDWRYSSQPSATATNDILANSFKSGAYGIHDGSIVLMHDIHENSVDAAIAMMDKLIDQGYTMVTATELLAVREGSVTSGKVYY